MAEPNSQSPPDVTAALKGLLERALATRTTESVVPRKLSEHFGTEPSQLAIVQQEFDPDELPNLQIGIDTWLAGGRTHELGSVGSRSVVLGAAR